MKLFNGLKKLDDLSFKKRRQFEKYYHRQVQYRLRPLFADLSLMVSIIGAIIYIVVLAQQNGNFDNIHPLLYVYAGIMVLLAVAHRTTKIRFSSPLIIYLMFTNMALFGYLDYIVVGGGLKPLLGLFFFISSIGFITFSLKHTLIIITLNFFVLFFATSVIPRNNDTITYVLQLFTNWLAIMCILVSPASAVFNRWLFRNILALQFLLNDTNKQLVKAFHSLKATEDKLIQQQKHQALSHMAASLLHEIVNPANCSIQAINYAKSINNDEQLNEVLSDASEHQSRIVAIVEDLKSFSQSRQEHEKSLEEFHDLFSIALRFCRNEVENIQIVNNAMPSLQIHCYPNAFIQVVVNLLINSAAALAEKCETCNPCIKIESNVSEESTTIRFRDNGIGIAQSELKQITEPFYSTNEFSEQLGLGLSICQTIIRHHDGLLKIDSEEGVWTEVTLILPN